MSPQSMFAKIISYTVSILHAKFYLIPCSRIREMTITGILRNKDSSAPYWALCTQIVSLFLMYLCILCINFEKSHSLKTKINLFQEFWKKYDYTAIFWWIFSKSCYTLIHVKITLNVKFHENLRISSQATSVIFLWHKHTDIQGDIF